MTKEQFYEINQRLEKWRRQRHLTKEKQRLGYLGNVYEEVSEYYRAKDEYENIDAIMDITVFTLNSFYIDYDEYIANDKSLVVTQIEQIIERINQNGLINMDYEYILINELELLTTSYGFDFYNCMIETINEIDSRNGYYDPTINKFVKYQGAYDLKNAKKHFLLSFNYKEDNEYWYFLTFRGKKKIKKWYKADYSKYKRD